MQNCDYPCNWTFCDNVTFWAVIWCNHSWRGGLQIRRSAGYLNFRGPYCLWAHDWRIHVPAKSVWCSLQGRASAVKGMLWCALIRNKLALTDESESSLLKPLILSTSSMVYASRHSASQKEPPKLKSMLAPAHLASCSSCYHGEVGGASGCITVHNSWRHTPDIPSHTPTTPRQPHRLDQRTPGQPNSHKPKCGHLDQRGEARVSGLKKF